MPAALKNTEREKQGDIFVVNGEGNNKFSRPSSPEPMSPEIAPLVATLLAQINQPLRLDSPEPSEDGMAEQETRLSGDLAQQGLTSAQKRDTLTSEDRLLMLPVKRELPWRPGVDPEAGIEKGGESRRKQIRYGCLLATRGDIAPVSCTSCVNGRGKFSLCIALEGFFKGACAGCQLGGGPNRCSIKTDDEDTPKKPALEKTTQFQAEKAPSVTLKKKRGDGPTLPHQAKKRRTDNGTGQVQSLHVQRELKMRHSDLQAIHQNPVPRASWPSMIGGAPAPTPAPLNPPIEQPNPYPQEMNDRSNGFSYGPGYTSHERHGQPSSQQWAAVNQNQSTHFAVAPPRTPFHNISTAAAQEKNGPAHPSSQTQERREETVGTEEGSVALIDTLPKAKQRQVFGLISGLQGGIENLQRELNSLKRAFGIDEGH